MNSGTLLEPKHYVSKANIIDDLLRLGVRQGDIVMCHIGLRSIGFLPTGPVTVLQALREVIGIHGTIIVPTFTTYLIDPSRWVVRAVPRQQHDQLMRDIDGFDIEQHPTQRGLGYFPELVRRST